MKLSQNPALRSESRIPNPESRLVCIGHRGARGHAPENTLLGLDTGIRLGAHAVEFDVQLHPSGELLLMHDLRVDRSTDGHGLLSDLSLPQLRALDAGQGQRIPTLQEALEHIDNRVWVNVELKTRGGTGPAVARVLRDVIEDGWPAERFVVTSFHLPELYEFKQAAPEIPIGVLYCGTPLEWAGTAAELGAVSVNLSAEFVDSQMVADAHARGMKVFVYTVNDPQDLALMRKLGVDGVFSDFPERVLR